MVNLDTSSASEIVNKLAMAVAVYDASDAACPARKHSLGNKPCPLCRAERNEGCGLEGQGATKLIATVRQLVVDARSHGGER